MATQCTKTPIGGQAKHPIEKEMLEKAEKGFWLHEGSQMEGEPVRSILFLRACVCAYCAADQMAPIKDSVLRKNKKGDASRKWHATLTLFSNFFARP